MSQSDDNADLARKVAEVALTAVLVVLCRDHGWAEDKALMLLAEARREVSSIAGWLGQRVEQ